MNRTRLSRQFGVVTRAVVEQTVSRGGGSGNSGGHMRLEDEPFDLRQRLDEVERRLRAIEELALSQVVVVGTAEQKLVDVELRLSRIHDLATSL
jgi:hypothetical protein